MLPIFSEKSQNSDSNVKYTNFYILATKYTIQGTTTSYGKQLFNLSFNPSFYHKTGLGK